MTQALHLDWLPPAADFEAGLRQARQAAAADPQAGWRALRALANHRIGFLETDRIARALGLAAPPAGVPALRLALAGTMTLDHLVPGLTVGCLRRGLALQSFIPPYGAWRQALLDPASGLRDFVPDAVLICAEETEFTPQLPVDAGPEAAEAAVTARLDEIRGDWQMIRDAGAVAIQQVPIPVAPPLFGHLDARIPAAPAALRAELVRRMQRAAAEEGVLILDPAAAAGLQGAGPAALHDRRLWLHARQHVSPGAAHWFGDQAARILAALRGLTRKVLVLDLDNTLWGGVLGDDGPDGIVIGEGSARGEAFKAFQVHARALRSRGILLAVSSKNDPQRAEAAFEHPEMVLRRADFAAFVADWTDKASGLQRIAQELDLGLDALVFFDDNPAERALVRETLPQVAVPEVPDAPEDFPRALAAAGYFEAVTYTPDDSRRADQYAQNAARRQMRVAAPDMDSFLARLDMTMTVGPVERVDLGRVTQLINKTNQFNLTTRRHTEAEVAAMLADPAMRSFCIRLSDRFGDNGIVSVVLARLNGECFEIETWLMSCRVLGRRVEDAVAHVLALAARDAGAARILGRYRPTQRNEIVAGLFARLGYSDDGQEEDGTTRWSLDPASAPPPPPQVAIVRAGPAAPRRRQA